jgi:hypothetical protein
MNAREWIDAFAAKLGAQAPSAREWSELLDLAGVAAHSSERVAAPVSCWVAARAGVTPARALEVARGLAEDGDGRVDAADGEADAAHREADAAHREADAGDRA